MNKMLPPSVHESQPARILINLVL